MEAQVAKAEIACPKYHFTSWFISAATQILDVTVTSPLRNAFVGFLFKYLSLYMPNAKNKKNIYRSDVQVTIDLYSNLGCLQVFY